MTSEVLDDSAPPPYRLEVVAARVRLPRGRIRRYIREGLVQPVAVEHRVPLFGEAEMARLRRIRRLTDDLGVNLAAVEIILRLVDELSALRTPRGDGGETALVRTPDGDGTSGVQDQVGAWQRHGT
jgi:MerR family transcriptional regulator/heat shock protein HspR